MKSYPCTVCLLNSSLSFWILVGIISPNPQILALQPRFIAFLLSEQSDDGGLNLESRTLLVRGVF